MADLPDIDTTQVSFLAYFNAIDQGGVSSIDPEEVTSSSRLITSTLYDNGIEGEIDLTPTAIIEGGPSAQYRVKSDGWIVAWVGRDENYGQSVRTSGSRDTTVPYPNSLTGWWDTCLNWAWAGDEAEIPAPSPPSIQSNSLARTIDHLVSQLSNGGVVDYTPSDAGLYNYQYSGATTTTVLSELAVGQETTPGFTYTSSTDLKAAVVTGAIHNHNGGGGRFVNFEGAELADSGGSQGAYFGTRDAIADGLIPNSGTEYEHSCFSNTVRSSGTGTSWFIFA